MLAGIAPYMALELASFDLLPHELPSFARGFAAALIATSFCYPLDTVRCFIPHHGITLHPHLLSDIPSLPIISAFLSLFSSHFLSPLFSTFHLHRIVLLMLHLFSSVGTALVAFPRE